jgi:plastocyanin
MSDATIFYILAGILAGLAVIVSFIGIKAEKFPGKIGPVVIVAFVAVIGATTTFAVLNGQHEEEVRAAEVDEANEEAEAVENDSSPPEPGEVDTSRTPQSTINGPGAKLELKTPADGSLAFDTTELSAAPGEVTITLDNPAPVPHNVAIEQSGKVLAESETIAEGTTSITKPLGPGEYTFLCTIPGHAEAGMQGTLTVK